MIKTNESKLVMLALQGQPVHADEFLPFEVGHDGVARALPGTGSITYNVKVGDSACGWKTDHTEPGVSTVCNDKEKHYARGYNFLACAGNEVRVVTGDAKGARGTVTGKHGGVEHIMIDFPDAILEKLSMDDKFLIKAVGQGLELTDHPEIKCYNLSPALLKKMNMREKGSEIEMGVTHIIPAKIMGSGIGSLSCTRGDYDITTQDSEAVKQYRLDTIRLGDIVAIQDADNSYGRCYKKGAVSICIVAHCDSFVAGHGPGITTIMTSVKVGKIKPFIDGQANVAQLLKIGRFATNRLR